MGQILRSSRVLTPLGGSLRLPGDKSISHRSLMFSALAEGTSKIEGLLEGEDCKATAKALERMGVQIKRDSGGLYTVHGVGLRGLVKPDGPLDMGNAGTGMRLFCGLLAGQKFDSELIGDESLSVRPMARVADPLNAMGANIRTTDGHAPIRVSAPAGALSAFSYELPVASAQLKSALLIAGLYAVGPVSVIEPAVSRDHTERMLRAMGVVIESEDNTVTLTPPERLSPVDIQVPADLSSAAFFLVAASIVPRSNLILQQIGVNPSRDGVLKILEMMGAEIRQLNPRMCGGEPVADLHISGSSLKAVHVSDELVPLAIDEFPVLFVAAAAAEGVSRFERLGELRHKESDRIAAMTTGLRTLGVNVKEGPDWVEITGGALRGGRVDSFHDHRIAMAFAVAGAVADDVVEVERPENIATSFPDFQTLAVECGLSVEISR
ncbi:MAG: 3-phosphoshikimate 1-carboxyvinyltransferase [Pseudomonadota bacterium]